MLDRKNVPVDAAFWYLDDDDEWEFYLHTPLLGKNSRKSVYRLVRDALVNEPGTLRLREINVLPASSELLGLLRKLVSTGGQGIVELRLTNNTINGVLVRDVLAYSL